MRPRDSRRTSSAPTPGRTLDEVRGGDGAASGIGRATAVHLARDGYAVALVDMDPSGMKETLHSIESESGVAKAFQADVCDSHQLGVVVREVLTSMGSPELLVNVAAIATTATILDTSDQEWSRVITTNLKDRSC